MMFPCPDKEDPCTLKQFENYIQELDADDQVDIL